MRLSYKVLVEQSKGKRSLGGPVHTWDDTKMRLKEIRYKGVNEYGLVAGFCEHDNELSGSIKGGIFLDYLAKLSVILINNYSNSVLWHKNLVVLMHQNCPVLKCVYLHFVIFRKTFRTF
jgi:hypothetical protein